MTEPAPVPARSRSGHPDREWVTRMRSALDHWEKAAPSTPTSTVLGGGAVAAAEAAFTRLHAGRPALLLPSATYALRTGLQALGVHPGDEVICPAIDWPASYAAITSLGAVPVPVPADPATITIDPAAAAAARTARTRAAVACHLHGICADVAALRTHLPGIGICEDASQAFGARLHGRLAGTLGDVAVFSLGPGKHIDAGEGGVLLSASSRLHRRAVSAACHPLRNLLTGMTTADPQALIIRPHPMTAVLALHALTVWSPHSARETRATAMARLAACPDLAVLELGTGQEGTQPYVPVLVPASDSPPPAGITWAPSGAQVIPGTAARDAMQALLSRVRLATPSSPAAEAARSRRDAQEVLHAGGPHRHEDTNVSI